MNNKSTEKKSSRNLVERLLQQVKEEDVSEEELMRCKRAVEKKNEMIAANVRLVNRQHLSSLSYDEINEMTWDKLDISDPDVLAMAKTVRAWRPHMDHGLFLCGPVGTGKTRMMKALILSSCSEERRFFFISMSNFMIEAKKYVSVYFHAGEYINRIAREYYGIVLDDLGTEKASDFQQEVLFLLIERFKRDGKKIFMTSNLSMLELQERYSERILNRLEEVTIAIESQKKSYRRKIYDKNRKDYFKNLSIAPPPK